MQNTSSPVEKLTAAHGSKLPTTKRPSRSSPPQKSIAEHFAHTKQRAREGIAQDVTQSSPRKRTKLDHKEASLSFHSPSALVSNNIQNMYSFSADKGHPVSTTIDLTRSPSPVLSPTRNMSNASIGKSTAAAPTGPRRLAVKNLQRSSRQDTGQYYRATWSKLEVALDATFSNERPPYPKEMLYNEVMIVSRQNRAPELLKALSSKLTNFVENILKASFVVAAKERSDVDFLKTVVDAWTTWTAQLEYIKGIFYFLDRSYILQAGLPSVTEMGAAKFGEAVFGDVGMRTKLLAGVSSLMLAERNQTSHLGSNNLLRDVVQMFKVLEMYSKYLDPTLLTNTQKFYWDFAQLSIASTDLAGYVEVIEGLMTREKEHSAAWTFDPATEKQFEVYMDDILVEDKKDRLTHSEDVSELLERDQLHVLRRIYELLKRRSLESHLGRPFEDYIVTQGSAIVFDELREQEMVSRLLIFKQKLDSAWEQAFEKNVYLGHTLREAFETFINKSKRSNMTWGTDNPKPGEMIAKYVDQVLKMGAKATRNPSLDAGSLSKVNEQDLDASEDDEDAEIGKKLDQVLDLFRLVHGKAVFEAFYKRDLARRLLLGRSASSDAEKSMLTRLKTECGAGFTHNLEQMFKDVELAREEISSYRSKLEEQEARPPFDLSVNVLSSAAWPSYPDVAVNVPETILKAVADFERYYKMKYSGRKLEWKHALAHCQLKSTFTNGIKEIVVSCFQALVLLSFNDTDALSYSDLQASTNLDDLELKRTLQSLACAKYRVLSKTPKGKDVNNDDMFTVNVGFHHPKYRIKINQIQAKETTQENRQTHERVAADRAFETQAAIVRIMKSRKTITHPELVSEVISATKSRGPLDPADIKKNIEKLIEKDYMERDEDAHNTYSYVA